MRFLLICMAAALSATSAIAQEATDDAPFADIRIRPDGDDMLVTVVLDAPVTRFAFARADVVREDAFDIVTPGLSLVDDAVVSDEPFASFGFRIAEDYSERDAKYPPYYRVGEGRLVYAPAIYPDADDYEVTLHLDPLPAGWSRWPDTPLPQGYVFMGPSEMVKAQGGASFAFDGNGDDAFEAEIRDSVTCALGYLQKAFGTPPAREPFVATSILPSDRTFYTGDVTDDAMVALRFFGDNFDPSAKDRLENVRSIILHEGVHFWNGGVASFAQGTPQWLHEGGAEYLALLGSYRLGWTDREAMRGRIGMWYDRCATSLHYSDEAALNDIANLNASLRYSCGPLLHVLAELYLADAGLPMTVTGGWRQTIALAVDEHGGEYDLPLFLAALGAPELLQNPALDAILAQSGAERWDTVFSEMQRLGVEVERRSSPILRARSVLMPVIASQCTDLQPGEGYGFYGGSETFRLDTPEGCGLLSGGPELATLSGYPVAQLDDIAYTQLRAICDAGETLAFGMADGTVIDVPCTTPLGEAKTQPAITGLPDIAAFAAP